MDTIKLRVASKEYFFNYFLPTQGFVSYGLLSSHIMNPDFMPKVMSKRDIASILLASTIFTTGVYIFRRPHLRDMSKARRGVYALMGSAMFNMGSVLAWALMKSALPRDDKLLSAIAGIVSSLAFVKVSVDYVRDCDRIFKK